MRLIDANTMYDCKTCYHDNNGKCQLGTFGCDHGEAYRPAFSKLEIVDAVPVRHGHWISHIFEEVMNGDWIVLSDWQGNGFECSDCGRLIAENKMEYKYKYCPNCGAKMDEDGR